MKSIVLFTSQDIGYSLTEFLAQSNVDLLVITEETTRSKIYGYRSAFEVCEKLGVPVISAKRVDSKVIAEIVDRKPDLIVSAYYPHLIPERVLKIPRLGTINIHPGMLPHHRGRFPTPWYILNGEDKFGISLHYLDASIDTGAVLVQETYPIDPDETGHEIYCRSMDLGASLFIDNFDAILSGELKAKEQGSGGSYYRSVEKRYEINWNRPLSEIIRRVRVHAEPYLPAYTFIFNKAIFINKVSEVHLDDFILQGGGEIAKIWPDGRFAVSCNDGCLILEEYMVCPPFRKEEEGLHIKVGNRLG